jgi:hypothetical protein
MIITNADEIISFLEGTGTDHQGRTYAGMLEWGNEQLELCHDSIQQIFPLHEVSKHASTYPIITKDIVERANKNPEILKNLLKATKRMERFFAIGEYYDRDEQRKWCKDRNHNLLRITRIIRCLRLFGLDSAARDFYDEVVRAGNYFGLSQITLDYWHRAMYDDVWETLQS